MIDQPPQQESHMFQKHKASMMVLGSLEISKQIITRITENKKENLVSR